MSKNKDEMIIRPVKQLEGTLTVPGDKSISHRALLLAALAEGQSTIYGLATGKDVASTASCLQALGVEMEQQEKATIVHGRGLHGLKAPQTPLAAGNSGTTMRLLAGILSGQSFDSVIDGDQSLRRRPMQRIIDPLTRMGAEITASSTGTAPLQIFGKRLHGITYSLPVPSAQVKSCVLLAGLFAEGTTTVVESVMSRNHTEVMLKNMGVPLTLKDRAIQLNPHPLIAREMRIPGDFSSAAFFLGAALLVPKSDISILRVGINPTRSHLLNILKRMGAGVLAKNFRQYNGEPVADLAVSYRELKAVEVGGRDIPLMIDEIPILAILATQAHGTTFIRDAGELRVKESDRLHALVSNLQQMGAKVEPMEDGLVITGPTKLQGTTLETYADHRIAMAFSIAGLIAQGETVIRGAQTAAVSFPEFFDNLHHLMK